MRDQTNLTVPIELHIAQFSACTDLQMLLHLRFGRDQQLSHSTKSPVPDSVPAHTTQLFPAK